ncbi:TetR/AcrR family transcriptional regulator [Pseudomonas capsici]|uniref:TetR/AcrR family transcriptional regulator n=1 Tax=Pseudomonas capsici TaxID=2810614 RepID=UPI0021F0FF97|nr:TetR/AcrR family transcriptional regulator [Pseudomonas capsici]MCV4276076.1 TetR/AcrR family transcriptional regulator [Pseudomonas capsici]
MPILEEGAVSAPLTRGRRRDPERDVAILDAAIEVLAESGYDGMTMDMVAARAKAGKATVYRRWGSKAELILEAVTHLKRRQVDLERLPDTGTLRGDLLALFKPQSVEEAEHKMRVMAGLAAVLLQNPQLADAGDAAIVQPWALVNRLLMKRALERGEISASADIDAASQVLPSMAAYRALIQRKPFDLTFLTTMIDGVLLPALKK